LTAFETALYSALARALEQFPAFIGKSKRIPGWNRAIYPRANSIMTSAQFTRGRFWPSILYKSLLITGFTALGFGFLASETAHAVKPGWTQEGIASYYYGPLFHGKLTANQEIYDENSLTAAHKTLPINTLVEVTRKANGKKVIVRINNRGPYVKGRIIDLSKEAARRLNMIDDGIAQVIVKVLPPNAIVQLSPSIDTETAQIVSHWFDYAILLETYSRREKAEQVVADLSSNGLEDLEIDGDNTDDGPIYKVLILGFEDEQSAADYLRKLETASLVFNWHED
jgi:rare lipoprotein A